MQVNNRSYQMPKQPVVVVCVDGCEPDYLGQAVAGGHMPWMKKCWRKVQDFRQTAWCQVLPIRIICPS
jgi:hypothetical protein